MTCFKDICRICLQEVDFNDVEPIDLEKLGRLVKKSLLPKWHLELFEDHVICSTCIDNFRTLRNLYKLAWSSNGQVMRHRRTLKSQPIDLKELKQLNKRAPKLDNFLLCRLCFEPTKSVAVHLFDSPHNIVPIEYVNCMIKHVHLYLTLLEITVNPILCFKCWQRIQVAFGFRKHIDLISEKVMHYQKLLNKSYLDREDLQDVFYMLDKLGLHPPSDSESSISEQESPKEENTSSGYIFFEEHNYFKKDDLNSCGHSMPSLSNKTFNETPALDDQMPVLAPNIEANTEDSTKEFKDLEASTRMLRNKNKVVPPLILKKDRILSSNKKLASKTKHYKKSHKNLANGISMEVSSLPKNKQKLVSILKSKMERQQQLNSTWPDSFEVSDISKNEILRPRTRLSAKRELSLESSSQDLLVLRKEEIIKKKPLRNSNKPLNPQHTSTPKVKENTTKDKQPLTKQPISNAEYTFERLNFDNEVQNDKNTIEAAHLQVKKEVISDSDDDFTENAVEIMEEDDDDEPCPNLDAFIKSEPEEIMELNDDDIDEPPELEFQGPCSYEPHFTISNTFTVSDKRQIISLDEKRGLMNSVGDNAQSRKPINEKPPLVKARLDEKPFSKEVVINLTKCPLEEPEIANKSVDIKPKSGPAHVHNNTHAKSGRRSAPERDSKPVMAAPNKKEVKQQTQSVNSTKCSDSFTKKTPLQSTSTSIVKNNKNNKNDKSLVDLSIIESYNEVDHTVSRKRPFECKLCDFKTTSKRGAKCHLTLHATDAAPLHFCNLCPYHTTNKANLKTHRSRAHSRDRVPRIACGFCHSSNAKLKCMDCEQFFHPKCALEDQSVQGWNCLHSNVVGCVQILRNRAVVMTRGGHPGFFCYYCKQLARNWVNCKTCGQYFHYKCFYDSRKPGGVDGACPHLFLGFSALAEPLKSVPKVHDKKGEQKRKCDFCGNALDSVIPCPMCFKFMHSACFQIDSKLMQFNCKHKDIVGEVPVAKCAYCHKDVEHNSVTCTSCNRTLHRYCLVVDRVKKTLNCQHTAEMVLTATRTKSALPEADERFKDAPTQPIASTSREIKQDLLDLTDFIMLCD